MNNAEFCYGNSVSSLGFCRGWTGNLVQVTKLGFHLPGDPAATVELTASPGYVMTAGSTYVDQAGRPITFPSITAPDVWLLLGSLWRRQLCARSKARRREWEHIAFRLPCGRHIGSDDRRWRDGTRLCGGGERPEEPVVGHKRAAAG